MSTPRRRQSTVAVAHFCSHMEAARVLIVMVLLGDDAEDVVGAGRLLGRMRKGISD